MSAAAVYPTPFRTNIRAINARAYVRIVGSNREPSWLITDTILPVLATSAYVFVYASLRAPPEFVGFVILGGAMTAFWLNVLWSMGTQFLWEKDNGNLEVYLVAPISRVAILLGMALGGMVGTSIRAGALVVAGVLIFGVRFAATDPLMVAVVFLVTLVALYGLGMLFTSIFFYAGRGGEKLAALFQEPIYLVSGFYFPVRSLGPYVALAASAIPITLGLDALRQLLFPAGRVLGFLPVPEELAILCLLAVLFIATSLVGLRRMEIVAKREGRLTLRWQ